MHRLPAGRLNAGVGRGNLLEFSNRISGEGQSIGWNSYYDGSSWKYRNSDYAASLSLDSSGNINIYTFPSGTAEAPLDSATGRFIVLNNGNVGIGKTNPEVKLDVNGAIKGSSISAGDAVFTGAVTGISGRILQIAYSESDTATYTSNESGTWTQTSINVAITPQYATSKILLMVSGNVRSIVAGEVAGVTIYRGGANIMNANYGGAYAINYSGNNPVPVYFNYVDSPNTTSSITYCIYIKNNGSGSGHYAQWNAASITTSLIALEIGQ